MPVKILIAMPVFNNGTTLGPITQRILSSEHDLLIINDGSTDNTQEVIDELGVWNIRFIANTGKGAAIRQALEWAKNNAYTHIITIDADGQHTPNDIP